MIFSELPIPGAFVVTPEPIPDERGAFARVFATEEFVERGIDPTIAQMSVASNAARGTLRGMHLQAPPHGETKLVRCIRGSAFDVIVDLRPQSSAFLTWASVTIDAQQRSAVSIPEGVAHGYLTLEADTELEYLISAPYAPSSAIGVRWDDPAVGVEWPFAPTVIGARDVAFPYIDPARLRAEGLGSLRPQGVQT
jgi:dTDP-4-dehydrorhamnose 3,5-epimerase